jgi:hypothetical protein
MSPTVPPISVMTTSWPGAARRIACLISSVMWGMTCTVEPIVLAAPFLADDGLVDAARGDVVLLGECPVDEALVVAQVEVRLGAVIGHEDLAVLERRHRARIDVDVRVELLHRHGEATLHEQAAERGRGDALAERRDDARR